MASQSVWQAATATANYSQLTRDLAVDVAIVGGGITGLTTALLLKRAGRSVAVLEALRIGESVTSYTAGHLNEVPNIGYQDLIASFGEDSARLEVRARRAAIERIAQFVQEEQIDCGFERVPGYLYSESYSEIDRLEAEAKAARQLGVNAIATTEIPLPFAPPKGILFLNQAQLNALAYVQALAKAIEGDGSYVFEQTRVLDVNGENPSRVYTPRGTVSAQTVVLATHTPIHDITRLQDIYITATIKVMAYQSYVIAVRLRSPGATEASSALNGLFWDTADPYHYTRKFVDLEIGELLLIGGESHKTGADINTLECYERLEAYARSHYQVESIAYRWSSQWYESVDGLPFIGKPLLHPHLYIATGYAGNGISYGTIAGMLISDGILDRQNPWMALYDPNRLKPFASALKFLEQNLDVPRHFFFDRWKREVKTVAEIPNGAGKLLEMDGEQIAAYRDETGELHAMSAVCSHLACIVNWNAAEKSWDCPCHGARFSCTGAVINGPAIKDLEPKQIKLR